MFCIFFSFLWFWQDHYQEKKGSNDNSLHLSKKGLSCLASKQSERRRRFGVDLRVAPVPCAARCLFSVGFKVGNMLFLPWALAGRMEWGGDFMEIKCRQERNVCEITIVWVPWVQEKPQVTDIPCGQIRKASTTSPKKQSNIYWSPTGGLHPLNTHSHLSWQQPCEAGWWPILQMG